MNKKGAMFATLTVILLLAFVVGASMNKQRILKESKIVETGKAAEKVINFSLQEEEVRFQIQKGLKLASYRALIKLGKNGGKVSFEESCKKIEESVVLGERCELPSSIEEEFFKIFEEKFKEIAKELGFDKINVDWSRDEKNEFYIETNGKITLNSEGTLYEFEPKIRYKVDYDFSKYLRIYQDAKKCKHEEERLGSRANNLFLECKKIPDEEWNIKIKEGFVIFEVIPNKVYKGLDKIPIKFALIYETQLQ